MSINNISNPNCVNYSIEKANGQKEDTTAPIEIYQTQGDNTQKINNKTVTNPIESEQKEDKPVLKSVNASQVKSYYPNIRITKISDEEYFDKGIENGIELSDGSILLRPTVMNTAYTQIKPTENPGEYEVVTTSLVGGYKHEPTSKIVSEEELLENKYLSDGTITKLGDDEYLVKYEEDGVIITKEMTKSEAIKHIKERSAHF